MVPISSHPCQHLPFSVFLLFSIFSCLIFIIYFFPVALGLARSFSSSLSCPSLFSALIDYPMQSRTRYKSPSKAIHWCKPLLLQCSRTVVTAVVFNILISSKNSKINPGGGGWGDSITGSDPTCSFLPCSQWTLWAPNSHPSEAGEVGDPQTRGRDGRPTPRGQMATAERPRRHQSHSPLPRTPHRKLVSGQRRTWRQIRQGFQGEKSKACVMRNSYNEIPFHYLETTGDFYRKEKKWSEEECRFSNSAGELMWAWKWLPSDIKRYEAVNYLPGPSMASHRCLSFFSFWKNTGGKKKST